MTFSTIMVCLDLERSNDVCLRIAVDLAAHFNAKLVGIAAASQESPDYGQQPLAGELAQQLRSNIAKNSQMLKSVFGSRCSNMTVRSNGVRR